VSYTTDKGEVLGYFVNAAHIGMGGDVADRTNRTTKVFGGFVCFFWGVLATLASYRNKAMRLEIDDTIMEGKWCDVIFANGKYDGGGMFIAPDAELASGVFEVFAIGDISRPQALANMRRIYRGTLKDRPDLVRYLRARRIVATSDEEVLVNLDGEQPGRLPATFELVPSALNLAVGG